MINLNYQKMTLHLVTLLLCIFSNSLQYEKYPYSQSDSIVVVNAAAAIFTTNGHNVQVTFVNPFSIIPKVSYCLNKYENQDQMTQQYFFIQISSITQTEFIINLKQNTFTSTHVDNVTIRYLAMQDIYNNVFIYDQWLAGFQNISVAVTGKRQDQVYFVIPQLFNNTNRNLTMMKIVAFITGFNQSSINYLLVAVHAAMIDQSTLLLTISTDGDCMIRRLKFLFLLINVDRFPSNVIVEVGFFQMTQNNTSFYKAGINQSDIIFGVSKFQASLATIYMRVSLQELNSNLIGSLGSLERLVVSYLFIRQTILNQTLNSTNDTNSTNGTNSANGANSTNGKPPPGSDYPHSEPQSIKFYLIIGGIIIVIIAILLFIFCIYKKYKQSASPVDTAPKMTYSEFTQLQREQAQNSIQNDVILNGQPILANGQGLNAFEIYLITLVGLRG